MIDSVLIVCCIMISTPSGVAVLWVSWNLPIELFGRSSPLRRLSLALNLTFFYEERGSKQRVTISGFRPSWRRRV
ncbi:hypothetical protein Hanom_Chr16g01440121 [Helianthus anomalus]